MNAAHAEARAQLHSWLVDAHKEGVEFELEGGGQRKGTYRKGPHIHVTGRIEKHWEMCNSHNYLFTSVLVYVREAFVVLSATWCPQSSVSAVCRQPAEEG